MRRKIIFLIMVTLLFFTTPLFITGGNGEGGAFDRYSNEIDENDNLGRSIDLSQASQDPKILRIPKSLADNPTNRNLDPYHGQALASDLHFYSLIYSPLIKYDHDQKTFVGGLITDWYSTLDATVWYFKLRKGVTFHDGTVFDTSIVELNFLYLFRLSERGELGQFGFDILSNYQSMEILSEYDFKITLNSPNGNFLSILTSKFMLSPNAFTSGLLFLEPIGSGPYIYNSEEATDELEIFDRFDDYYEGLPPFEKIEMYNYLGQEQINKFQDGELDVIPEWYGELDNNDDIVTNRISAKIIEQFGAFNFNNPILANPGVRLALNLALDRDRLDQRQSELWGFDIDDELIALPYSLYSDIMPYTPESEFPYNYDSNLANQLLDNAGYPIQANGSRFTLNLVTRVDGEYSFYFDLLADFFEELNITVIVDILELSEWIGRIGENDFDIIILTSSMGTAPTGDSYSEFLTSSGSLRFGNYFNETLDQLFFAVKNTPVGNEQQVIYAEIFDVIAEDVPYLWIEATGTISYVKESVSHLVRINAALQYEFTYQGFDGDNLIITSLSADSPQVYLPRQELSVVGSTDETNLNIVKSRQRQSHIDNVEIEGDILSTYEIDFLGQQESKIVRLYVRKSENIDLNEVTLYQINDGKSKGKSFTINETTNYIEFEVSESSQYAFGREELQFAFVSVIDWKISEVLIVLSIFGIGSILLFLDQRRRAKIRSEKVRVNVYRYLLFLPNVGRIFVSIVIGLLAGLIFSFGTRILPIWFSSIKRQGNDEREIDDQTSKPNVYVNEILVQRSSQPIPELKGRSIDLYYYLLQNPGFHGVRDIQRTLSYSSASLVHYHLTRLIKANTITKSEDGKYGIPDVEDRLKLKITDFENMTKIVPRTFLSGITLLILSFTLLVTSLFVSDIFIWVRFVSPICFILSLVQFRTGLSLVWNLQAESDRSKGLFPTDDKFTFDDIQNMVTRAISLKQSGRAKDTFEAQNILEKVLKSDKISNELAIVALFNLCDIMVDELKIKEEVEIFRQAENLSQQIVTLANEMESNTLTVEALLIQSKFNLIKGDYEKSVENLQDAEYFSSDNERLQTRVREEITKIRTEVERYRTLGSDPGLVEKLERVKIKDYLDEAIKMLSNKEFD